MNPENFNNIEDMFDEYLKETGEDRQKYKDAYGYGDSEEWEAWQAGWNAAKKHFGVEE